MTQPMRPSPDSLLAHEPFVRAVVRDLLRDESHVQDVLQETWIRALHQGPSKGGSLKGWLARVARRLAIDQHRGSARRDRREREAARGEALESVDALHARLEAQREVVDAVLALEEPYKSVVLLAYYEQLAPQAIGERLGRSAATVRSQLSRAHEILRGRLDAHHGGDRSAWAGVLLPWAIATKSKAGVAIAAGIGVALLGTGAWLLPRMLRADLARDPASLGLATSSLETRAESRNELDAGSVPSNRSVAAGVPPPVQVGSPVGVPDLHLATLDNGELMNLAVQAMRAVEKRVLTPDARFAEEEKALLVMPDTGIVRLLARTEHGSTKYEGLVFPREGGCFFSFATSSHDYDAQPDICYEQDSLMAQYGMLLQVGDVPLAEIGTSVTTPPAGLGAEAQARWEFLFAEIDQVNPRAKQAFEERRIQLHMVGAQAVVRQSYVLRAYVENGHDLLVALRILGKEEGSVTFGWRVLVRRPHPGAEVHTQPKPTFSEVPAGPSWMDGASVEDLAALLHSIRAVAEPRILSVNQNLVLASAWLRAGAEDTSGWFRVVPWHEFGPLIDSPGTGAFYSMDRRAHVEYTQGEVRMAIRERSANGAGGTSWALDLGELVPDELPGVVRGEAPRRMSKLDLEKWSLMWDASSVLKPGWKAPRRGVKPEDFVRADELRLRSSIRMETGRSFLLRSIRESGADHLLLMTTLEALDDGTSFSWRELKRFDR